MFKMAKTVSTNAIMFIVYSLPKIVRAIVALYKRASLAPPFK